jgi:hypothetical protein
MNEAVVAILIAEIEAAGGHEVRGENESVTV